MIIAGPCLWNPGDDSEILSTADNLNDSTDLFRVKLWGGGTSPEKYFPGIGNGPSVHSLLTKKMKVITEVQTPKQIDQVMRLGLHGVWIGARNSQNYGLLQHLGMHRKAFEFIGFKRGPGMTIEEVINLCLMYESREVKPFIIERGINTIDRGLAGRWSPDLKIAYYLKHKHPDLFEMFVVDCSHSAGEKIFVEDVYKAFKAIGVKNFMFECLDGESKTDRDHMLTTDELKGIVHAA